MIVCQCNVITSRNIKEAVGRLMELDELEVVTPGAVFRCCGQRPQCGGCMPHLVKHMEAAVLEIRGSACQEHQSAPFSGLESGEVEKADEGSQEGHRISEQGSAQRADRGEPVLGSFPAP
jgi:bacterioferritin-associated ferredoxin